jgi:hypothetical protein
MNRINMIFSNGRLQRAWSVMAEWLVCRTLNQRVVDSNPGEGTAWYL